MSSKIKETLNSEKIQQRAIKNLKSTRNGGKRFWEESSDFSRNFEVGETVNCYYDFEKRIFIVEKSEILGTHTISSRQNGKAILDIKNKKLSELFENVEKVEILYYPNKLVVKVASSEVAKQQRKAKKGFRTFEIFSGAGTLTQMFKQAGFYPIGGLEIEDKYLVNYEFNHRNQDTYTISSSIEDVLPKDYIEADVGIVGIPCTAYSNGNKQMIDAIARRDKGISNDDDKSILEKLYTSQALTYYVIEAIRSMQLRTIVIEEVVSYSKSPESFMLRTVLKQMGYNLSETISEGSNSIRKRWCLVADMNKKIDLENILPSCKKTIEDFLDIPSTLRDWKTEDSLIRVKRAREKGLGIRSCLPTDKKTNTFTTNKTRHTEPILKHPTLELYSEFTNNEIRKIHGLSNDFVLPEKTTHARQILGQGVTNIFYFIAKRIKETYAS